MAIHDQTEELRTSHIDALSLSSTPVRSACLLVVSGGQSGRIYRLGSESVVGRGADTTICIDDEGVSRHHARFTAAADGRFTLADCQSRNGTFCNGKRIDSCVLEEGDLIMVGRLTILKFGYQDASEEQLLRNQYDFATRDGLTGCFNRRYFNDCLHREFQHAARTDTCLALVLLDVDRFKHLNDTYGHPVGDQVLRHLGAALAAMTRQSEVVARYGGEEFAVILRDTDGAAALAIAERWRAHLADTVCMTTQGGVHYTASFGVACTLETSCQSPEDLIATADRKLYEAKRSGRNRAIY